ncbi:MAG: NlpC/P60 family protein [Syntrophales bacterium]|jgi:cell wall-associated NlpC family hydrolase
MMQRRIFPWMGLLVLFQILFLCAGAIGATSYKVKNGDNLYNIARKTGASVDALKAANGLHSNALKVNQTIVIPTSDSKKSAKNGNLSQQHTHHVKASLVKTSTYVVRRGESVYLISKKTGLSVNEIKRLNHIRSNRLRAGQKLVLSHPNITEASVDKTEESDDPSVMEEDDNLTEQEVISGEDMAEIDQDKQASSALLGHWNDSKERDLLVKVAKGFLGAPYRFGGSSVRGLDCSAFVKKMYQFFDVSLPRTAREQARVGVRVPRENLEEGDLVFFNTRHAFGHVGIYIGNNEFVHAASGRQRSVTISNLDDPYYNKHFIKAVRIKDLEKEV